MKVLQYTLRLQNHQNISIAGSEKKLKNVLNTLSQSGAPMQVCGLRRAALFDDVTRLIKQRQPGIAERIVAGAATVTTTTKKSRTLF